MSIKNKFVARLLCGFCAVTLLMGNYSLAILADNTEKTEAEESTEEETEDSEETDNSDEIEEIEANIKEKQQEIDAAEEKRKELQSGLTEVKKIKESLEAERSDLQAYVTKLDQNLADVEAKIAELKTLITEKEEEIEETTKDLEDAQEKEAVQYQAMKDRIKFLYEKGDNYYLELLFSSKGFSDFINKQEYIQRLSEYDTDMFEKYVKNRELIEVCKAELEAEEELLTEAKAKVDEEQKNLEELITTKEQEINRYTGDINDKQKAIAEYEADIAMENETIRALEAALAEERKRLLEENRAENIIYDGGMFKWPAPSYTRISSEYGWRMHPTLGVEKFHNGVDMAAPGGSPILAAYDGEVIGAGYNSSMGNYIMINHGGGLITIYMHASALYVSTGTMVARGEKIAAVGTTGRSTGNHLHFGVRLNGEYVNPWNYLSK